MDDPTQSFTLGEGIRYIWNLVLTSAGGILAWMLNRLMAKLDSKADLTDLAVHKQNADQRFDQMQQMLNRMLDTQDRNHKDNTDRFDRLFTQLVTNGRNQR